MPVTLGSVAFHYAVNLVFAALDLALAWAAVSLLSRSPLRLARPKVAWSVALAAAGMTCRILLGDWWYWTAVDHSPSGVIMPPLWLNASGVVLALAVSAFITLAILRLRRWQAWAFLAILSALTLLLSRTRS